MTINEIAIEELTRLKIESHFKDKNITLKMKKSDLINICIKVIKEIIKVEE